MNLEPWREQPLPTIPFVNPQETLQYPPGESQQFLRVPLGKSQQLLQDSPSKSEQLLDDPLEKSQLPQDTQSDDTENAHQENLPSQELQDLQDPEILQITEEAQQIVQFPHETELSEVEHEQTDPLLQDLQVPEVLPGSQLSALSPVSQVPLPPDDPQLLASHDSQVHINSHDPQRTTSHESEHHVISPEPILPGSSNPHHTDSRLYIPDKSLQPGAESVPLATDQSA